MNALTTRHHIEIIQRSVNDTAARSLELLEMIEQTISSLNWVADKARADATILANEVDRIQSVSSGEKIDETGTLAVMLESVQDTLARVYKLFVEKRNAAVNAPELTGDDGVVDAYANAIENIGDLHDTIDDLRWAVMNHDALLDVPYGEPTSDVDALFARILG